LGFKKQLPQIDVVIPAYNEERFIVQAIRSVDEQTCKPSQIIIVNDGSTDKTEELILSMNNIIVPLVYVKKENGGLSSARNAGIRHSTADFVAFLDADDEWERDKLKEQVAVFLGNQDERLGVVYCNYRIIDIAGNYNDDCVTFQLDHGVRGHVFEALLSGNKIASSGSGVLIRRECFDKVGLFDENLSAAEDWDMWLRLSVHYDFDYVDKALVKIRRHDQNMQSNIVHVFENELRIFSKWSKGLPSTSPIVRGLGRVVSSKVISRLPRTDCLAALRTLPSASRKKLFGMAFGSLGLYLFGRILAWIGTKVASIIKSGKRVLCQCLKRSLSVLSRMG
jgi:glycosyltransferase involved in cell wall biosynthesis